MMLFLHVYSDPQPRFMRLVREMRVCHRFWVSTAVKVMVLDFTVVLGHKQDSRSTLTFASFAELELVGPLNIFPSKIGTNDTVITNLPQHHVVDLLPFSSTELTSLSQLGVESGLNIS